jgi:hypothetical protein
VECDDCPAGRFNNAGIGSTPDTTLTPETDPNVCDLCPDGKNSNKGDTVCTSCEPGTAQQNLESGDQTCTPCAAGKRAQDNQCVDCEAGK